MKLVDAANEFLTQKRIAVAGVSRSSGEAANLIYRTMRRKGIEAFPVNPNATEVEGDPCFPNLAAIPGGVDAVVIATHADVTPRIVRDCAELGVTRVWMHQGMGTGSVSEEAARWGRERGMTVIEGGCPLMFGGLEFGHRCMRWFLNVSGALPRTA